MIIASGIGQQLADVVADGPIIFGVVAAALAGLVSFASPCVVPLVPGYMSYLAGIVGGEMNYEGRYGPEVGKRRQWAVVGAAWLFVLGFTIIFLLASVTIFGAVSLIAVQEDLLRKIGGIVTIVMGVVFLGWIPGLQKDTRAAPRRWTTLAGAPLLGAVFALGWTPCLGPTLGAIISISVGTQGMTALRGVILIIGYCLGLGLPFVLVALGSARAMRTVEWLRKHALAVRILGGVTMIAVGLALLTGTWDLVINWVRQLTVNFGTTLL